MNIEEVQQINSLQSLVDVTGSDDNDDWEMLDGVLRGSTALAISHYGGDLNDILEQLTEECRKVNR